MILQTLEIRNFKNIGYAACSFAPKLNCLFGGNGMGKTNLLDAIHYLSMARSHIGTYDADAILIGQDHAVIQGGYTYAAHLSEQEEERIVLKINKDRAKQLSRNGKTYPRLSDHIGRYPLVIISPQDYKLIRGGSEERRRFFDRLLSQNNAAYLAALIDYQKALEQRNTLLRNGQRDATLYDFTEHVLAARAVFISQARAELTRSFIPIFSAIYTTLSQGVEEVSLCYKTAVPTDEQELIRLYDKNRTWDLELGHTSVGIHKDDWDMLIGERLMRKTGSEGQNKTFLIALKMTEYRLLNQTFQNKPLLLLDDLFDKLDADRVERIIHLVSGTEFGQIFVTDTNRKYLDEVIRSLQGGYALFHLQNGTVQSLL